LGYACENAFKEKSSSAFPIEKIVPPIKGIDTAILQVWEDHSFELEDGRFLKYFCEGEELFIKYGDQHFERTLEDTFDCSMPYARTPSFRWLNDEFICLYFGCGNPCWGSILLPSSARDTPIIYMYPYTFDQEHNLIVNIDYDEEKDEDFLAVQNLITQEKITIEMEQCDTPAFKGYCIDSISLVDKSLYLQTRTDADLKKGFRTKGSIIKKIKIDL